MPIDPLRRTTPTPFAAEFCPLGLRLRVASNDAAVLDAARASFGGYGAPPEDRGASDLVIELLRHELPQGPLARPLHRGRGHLIAISLGASSGATLDLRAGYAFGFVAPELVADQFALRVCFLEALCYSFLQQHPFAGPPHTGYVGVHGACVLPPGARAALILRARSGVGKSVLSYACLKGGFRLLAEDVTWLELRAGRLLRLWGAPWLLHLRPEAALLFPELAGLSAYRRPSGVEKIALSLPELFPGSLATEAPPGALCFLERQEGRATALEQLAPEQAHELFLASEGEELDAPRYAAGASALLKLPAYRLRLGGEPGEALRALALIKL